MKRQIYPSAPAFDLYSLAPGSPAPPPYPGPASHQMPGPSGHQIHPLANAPPTQGDSYADEPIYTEDLLEAEQDGRGQEMGAKVARFRLKEGKQRKRQNPQLYTKRGCTDVICCFLFVLFTVGWGVVAAIGLMWGDPERLIYPTDTLGRRCGGSRPNSYNFTDNPYLFYFDITKCISYTTALGGCQTPQICVSKCPNELYSYIQLQAFVGTSAEFTNKVQSLVYCTEDVNKATITNFVTLKGLVQAKKCASYTVKSVPVLGRCMPEAVVGMADTLNQLQKANMSSSLDVLKNTFTDDPNNPLPRDNEVKDTRLGVDYQPNNTSYEINTNKKGQRCFVQLILFVNYVLSFGYMGSVVNSEGVVTKIFHDLSKTWWQVLALIVAAGVLAFIWTVIMRILGSFMIWTSILAVVGVLSAGSGYSWFKWNSLVKAGAVDDFSFQPIFSVYFEMPTTWLVVAIVISVVLLILLLILLFVRKRISIAVALIEESSKAVGNMMSTLIFPLFPFVLHILVFALWGTVSIWLASSGQDTCRTMGMDGKVTNSSELCDCNSQNPTCIYVGLTKKEDTVFWLQVYNLFAFFWVSCFVTALGDIALAGAFASHYWAFDKSKDLPSFPVLRALGRAVRYNLGSLAFGSLIIALIKIIRVMLEYLDNKAKTTQSQVLKYILTALKCCFWCMEVFFKFLTKNAYIMMAIYGRNFFTSAKDSFLLLTRNIVRTVVVNQVAGILLFIGKSMITLGMGTVAFFYFSGQWVIKGIPTVELYYYFVPIIIVLMGSYFMADLFFDVYEMAVDTTFICFLEDSEQNDGSPEKPFYMSKRLQEILGKQNEKMFAFAK